MAHLNKVHGLFVRRGVCMRIAYLIRFLRQKGPGWFLSNYLGALLHTVQSQLSIELLFFSPVFIGVCILLVHPTPQNLSPDYNSYIRYCQVWPC